MWHLCSQDREALWRYIKDDGDAPLRVFLGAKSETLSETPSSGTHGKQRQAVGNSREEEWSGRLDLNPDKPKTGGKGKA